MAKAQPRKKKRKHYLSEIIKDFEISSLADGDGGHINIKPVYRPGYGGFLSRMTLASRIGDVLRRKLARERR